MGLLAGQRPKRLGLIEGQFVTNGSKPNYVHSQMPKHDAHYVSALPIRNHDQWLQLVARVKNMPRTKLITLTDHYLHAECATILGFVDDLELHFTGSEVAVKSAARLGYRDFGVNRKRVESLRFE